MSELPLKFDAQGLVPAIVQDHLTGQIRMFAYATQVAVRKTLETGLATFWSRSRGELWQKGRIGGHETHVVRVLADCDGDCIIYSSDPQGPSCHSGAPSCFFHVLEGENLVQASEQPQTLLALLESTKIGAADGVGLTIREVAGNLAEALDGPNDDRVVQEAASALIHLVAALRARAISLRSVFVEVSRRLAHDGAASAST
jgi:phosphoribosyl-ATP pyrophosphohydrolase/phosphoribosyl-AMP cyclohydrolase